jgi:hypothetical protein
MEVKMNKILAAFIFALTVNCSTQDPFNLNENYPPKYSFISQNDVSIAGAKRYSIKIKVPIGLNRDELTFNFKHALKKYYEQYKTDALMIFAYRNDDNDMSSASAGIAIYAPYGDWARAQEKTNYQISLNFNEPYFNDSAQSSIDNALSVNARQNTNQSLKQKPVQIGDVVTLQKKCIERENGNIVYLPCKGLVNVYDNNEIYRDENITVKVNSGTKGAVKDIKKFFFSGYTETLYLLEIKSKSKTYSGWVKKDNVNEHID